MLPRSKVFPSLFLLATLLPSSFAQAGEPPPRVDYVVKHKGTTLNLGTPRQTDTGLDVDVQALATCRIGVKQGLFKRLYVGDAPCNLDGTAWWSGGDTTATVAGGTYTLQHEGKRRAFTLGARSARVTANAPLVAPTAYTDTQQQMNVTTSPDGHTLHVGVIFPQSVQAQILQGLLAKNTIPRAATVAINSTTTASTPIDMAMWTGSLCQTLGDVTSVNEIESADGWSSVWALYQTDRCGDLSAARVQYCDKSLEIGTRASRLRAHDAALAGTVLAACVDRLPDAPTRMTDALRDLTITADAASIDGFVTAVTPHLPSSWPAQAEDIRWNAARTETLRRLDMAIASKDADKMIATMGFAKDSPYAARLLPEVIERLAPAATTSNDTVFAAAALIALDSVKELSASRRQALRPSLVTHVTSILTPKVDASIQREDFADAREIVDAVSPSLGAAWTQSVNARIKAAEDAKLAREARARAAAQEKAMEEWATFLCIGLKRSRLTGYEQTMFDVFASSSVLLQMRNNGLAGMVAIDNMSEQIQFLTSDQTKTEAGWKAYIDAKFGAGLAERLSGGECKRRDDISAAKRAQEEQAERRREAWQRENCYAIWRCLENGKELRMPYDAEGPKDDQYGCPGKEGFSYSRISQSGWERDIMCN